VSRKCTSQCSHDKSCHLRKQVLNVSKFSPWHGTHYFTWTASPHIPTHSNSNSNSRICSAPPTVSPKVPYIVSIRRAKKKRLQMAPECCCRRPHEFQFRRYRRFHARGAATENARSPIHTLLRLLHSLARHIACLGVNRLRLALETPSDMAKNVAMAIFQCQRRGKRDSLETHRWYTATELVYTQDDTQDSSDGDRQRAKAFNKLGGSKRSYTSERKENRP